MIGRNISALIRLHRWFQQTTERTDIFMYYDLRESGKRIAALRKEQGYTQETFADAIGMSQKTVAGIEVGSKGTTIDTMVAIAEVLHSSLDYLVSGVTSKSAVDEMLEGMDAAKQELALRILKGILENI